MKTKKLTIAIAIVAMTFIGTSCGNKQQKSASEATTEQSASSALEIDSLLANAESLAGQEVTIEGVCTHTCKHGAKKIFLMGSDDTQVIRVEAGTLGAFDPKCVNSIVRVTGTLKEQRIDEGYRGAPSRHHPCGGKPPLSRVNADGRLCYRRQTQRRLSRYRRQAGNFAETVRAAQRRV